MKLIIISGRSGSGKSVALKMLEDLNYYCVDNLPIDLLSQLIDSVTNQCKRLAISIDARNLKRQPQQAYFEYFDAMIGQLNTMSSDCRIIYLDAQDDILIKRFRETRRKHPLGNTECSLEHAIKLEKKILRPLAQYSALKIDTSSLSIKTLRLTISNLTDMSQFPLPLLIIQSFAYKYGIPIDTDFIFDTRCLPNPYWEREFRDQTGLDHDVVQYFYQHIEVNDLYQDIKNFIAKWLPAFTNECRQYLSIAIGCTGGQHRSVYLAEKIGNYFKNRRGNVFIKHRELS